MESTPKKKKRFYRSLAVSAAVLVLAVVGTLFLTDWKKLTSRSEDLPPTIDFTWTPLGPLDLKDFRGYLTMKDDYALDFTTYRFTIVELNKTVDLPIPGMIGKEYDSPISLALVADRAELADKDRITVRVSIADDKGQKTEIERVIRLKPRPNVLNLTVE